MASTTTIFPKLYVTIQYRKDASTESGLLGFASPYTKDAAFNKRKGTQDQWAYHGCVTVNIDENDNVSCVGNQQRVHHGHDSESAMFNVASLFMAKCYPIITNNEPLEGFEIAKSVRRYGWSGSGNVVWRIADPRGFELEISSDNFARVIDCATIVNGVIQGRCVWGRDGGKNILLPESSDVYQAAVKRTKQVNTKISLTDVKVGDTVSLLSKNGEDLHGQYLGKYFFLQSTGNDDCNVFWFNKKQTERYLFKQDDGKYFVLSAPKIVEILNKIATPLDKKVVAQEATNSITNKTQIKDIDDVILISPTKIKLAEVQTALTPFEWNDTLWPTANNYYTQTIICYAGGQEQQGRSINVNDDSVSGYQKPKIAKLQACNVDLAANCIKLSVTTESGGTSYWNRYSRNVKVYIPEFDMVLAKKYQISVTANGITGKVIHLGYS